MPKYTVVGGDRLIETMFNNKGWTEDLKDPDLVVWSGGSDVNPAYYGEETHPRTWYDNARDEREILLYHRWMHKPKVGICRGGQFLNVMNGGSMWQDVNNHTGSHHLIDKASGKKVLVTSTHHQMMRPLFGNGCSIVATANVCTRWESGKGPEEGTPGADYEVVYYKATRSLCFQPHPEYEMKSCEDYFWSVLTRWHGHFGVQKLSKSDMDKYESLQYRLDNYGDLEYRELVELDRLRKLLYA